MLKKTDACRLGPAACAVDAGSRRRQDLLLDLARLAGRPGLDLLPRRRRAMGRGHRQHRQHLVPLRRRAVAPGGGARRDRRQAPTASSRRAPIRAAWSRSPRRRTPPTSRSSTSTRPTRPRASTPMSAATTSSSARHWAQYLVDKGLVKSGDFVWMPVEVPGATYGVQEEEGIKSVFEPLGITYEVTDATLDQAEIITRMSDYLTANRDKVKAIIGLGDLVTGSIKRVFDQVGVAAGRNPGRRLGQLARHHAGGAERLRQRRAVAGPAGDELCRPVARRRWRRAASRRASTSSPARSTRRTPRRSTTTSCRASSRSEASDLPSPCGEGLARGRHAALDANLQRQTAPDRRVPRPQRTVDAPPHKVDGRSLRCNASSPGPSSGRSCCSSSSSWSSPRSTRPSCRRRTSPTRWPSPSSSA